MTRLLPALAVCVAVLAVGSGTSAGATRIIFSAPFSGAVSAYVTAQVSTYSCPPSFVHFGAVPTFSTSSGVGRMAFNESSKACARYLSASTTAAGEFSYVGSNVTIAKAGWHHFRFGFNLSYVSTGAPTVQISVTFGGHGGGWYSTFTNSSMNRTFFGGFSVNLAAGTYPFGVQFSATETTYGTPTSAVTSSFDMASAGHDFQLTLLESR